MKKVKDALKKFLFSKLKPVHIISTLIVTIILVIFVVGKFLAHLAGTNNVIMVLFILSFLFLLSRLTILTKVGIGFLTIIMFGVMLVFGTWVNLIMIWSTTAIFCWLAVRPTPIDFAINKGVASVLAQAAYLTLWTFAMIPFYKIFSADYIMAHLTFTYMISVLIYVIFMVICLPLLAREPVPMALINGIIMLPIQWVVITLLGPRFMEYMLTFL